MNFILLLLIIEYLITETITITSSCYKGCTCVYDTMNCINQTLTDIPELPEYITNLQLSNNRIEYVTRIDLLEYLNHLDLSSNQIKIFHLNLSHSSLITLKLSDNPISFIQIQSGQLKVLNVSWCDISRLQSTFLDQLPALEVLDLSYNPIKVLYPFKSNLKELYIRGCLIHDLASIQLPMLQFLDISQNKFMQILRFQSNLTVLKAEHGVLYQADLVLPKLKVLDVSNNKLGQVMLDSESIRFIDLSWNSLRTMKINSKTIALETLDLSNNLLDKVELNVKHLAFLNVSFNPIKVLNVSSNRLQTIDCTSCQLKSITLPSFIHCLNLSKNNLEKYEGDAEILDLSHNLLDCYKGRGKFVNLQGNRFSLPKNVSITGSALLGDNPWLCSCEDPALKDLYLKAIDRVTCASPEGKTWDSCFTSKLPKYLTKYPWLSSVVSISITIVFIVTAYFLKRKLWPDNRAVTEEHSQSDFAVVEQEVPRREHVDDRLPSYEEALLMNKPRYVLRRSYEFVPNRRLSSSSI